MINTRQFTHIVHRSLLVRDLLGGVPVIGLIFIFVLSVIFIYGMEMPFMIAPIIVLFFVMRVLTKKDPWLIDIVLDNISQKDMFIP